MGFIKKVGDKRYLIKFNVRPTNGKARQQKTETLKGCTKKQAEAILAQRKAQVDSGTFHERRPFCQGPMWRPVIVFRALALAATCALLPFALV